MNSLADDSRQNKILSAVAELKNNLDVAQKKLDQNLKKVKKDFLQKNEKEETKTETAFLKKIDAELDVA